MRHPVVLGALIAKSLTQEEMVSEERFLFLSEARRATFMTMAPGRKKRGFLIEIIFISVLLFLLISSVSQASRSPASGDFKNTFQRGLSLQPALSK